MARGWISCLTDLLLKNITVPKEHALLASYLFLIAQKSFILAL